MYLKKSSSLLLAGLMGTGLALAHPEGDINKDPVYGGAIIMSGIPGLNGSFDPTDGWRDAAFGAMYDGAYTVNWLKGPRGTGEETYPNFWFINIRKQMGQLFESWEIHGINGVTFRMRQGVHYWREQDVFQPNPNLKGVYGTEMTAQDIVDRWNLEAAKPGTAASDRDWKWTVREDDPWLIDIEYPEPDAAEWFFVTLDRISFSPPELHQTEGVDPAKWQDGLGTGPWIPIDHVNGVSTTLKKNPTYWDTDPFNGRKVPYMDKLTLVPTADNNATAIAGLRTGQIDIYGFFGLQPEDTQALAKSNPELGHRPQGDLLRGYNPNLAIEGTPWGDRRVRHAAMMAVNRQEMIDSVYLGLGYAEGYPAQRGHGDKWISAEKLRAMGRPDLAKLYEYHPEESKRLLAEAGYPDGFDTTIMAHPQIQEDAELFASYLNAVGIRATLDVMEATEMYNTSQGPEPGPRFTGLTFIDAGAPQIGFEGTMNFHHDPNATLVWFGNPMAPTASAETREEAQKISEMWERLKVTEDPDEYEKLYTELYLYVIESSWHIVSVTVEQHIWWQPWVKGYDGANGDLIWQYNLAKYFWLDCELKESSSNRACGE
jgi:ABC-type transport system substrate-binding protein